jgi:hypothetical protein
MEHVGEDANMSLYNVETVVGIPATGQAGSPTG